MIFKETTIENYIDKLQINYEDDLISKIDFDIAFSKLELAQQEVIRLRYFEELSQYQVANMLYESQAFISKLEKKAINSIRGYYQVR